MQRGDCRVCEAFMHQLARGTQLDAIAHLLHAENHRHIAFQHESCAHRLVETVGSPWRAHDGRRSLVGCVRCDACDRLSKAGERLAVLPYERSLAKRGRVRHAQSPPFATLHA